MLTCESSALMQRCLWLDWLRLLALFLVVICHCCDPLLFNPLAAPSAELSFWGAVWQSSTRACVPLFVCITGALLLPARESTFRFWKRRITRVLWPFLIWSALYCLFPWLFLGLGGAEPPSPAHPLLSAAAQPTRALSSPARPPAPPTPAGRGGGRFRRGWSLSRCPSRGGSASRCSPAR